MEVVSRNGMNRSGMVDGPSWVLAWLCLSNDIEGERLRALEMDRVILRLMGVARKLSNGWWRLELGLFEA